MGNPIPDLHIVSQAAGATAEGGGSPGSAVQTQARTQSGESWPSLPLDAWQDTYATLHLWTQIVGKVRLALAPPLNHWWAVTLYVDPRGLTTGSIPYGNDSFEVAFDFLDQTLWVRASTGGTRAMALYAALSRRLLSRVSGDLALARH